MCRNFLRIALCLNPQITVCKTIAEMKSVPSGKRQPQIPEMQLYVSRRIPEIEKSHCQIPAAELFN